MARKPKDYGAAIREEEERRQKRLERLNEQRRAQFADFVVETGADKLDPFVLVGGLLSIVRAAQTPATAAVFRREGEAFFDGGADGGGGADTGGASARDPAAAAA